MPPQPTPLPAMEARQYVTVSSAMVVTATVDPNASFLPVDGQANSSADAADYGTVTFEGVGGTLTADKLTTTSTVTDPASPTAEGADVTNTPKSQSISMGAVVAVAVVVAALCLLLILCFWYRRRKSKKEKNISAEHQPMDQEMSRTYVGGHGYGKETPEGAWEKFSQPTSASLHVPGNIPSPTSSKLFVSDRGDSQRHLLNKLSVSTSSPSYYTADSSRRGPPAPRRHSVKSTVTGKVNPSNNFANDDEDEYDDYGSDAKSHRSRGNHLSPPSGLPNFQGLGALGVPRKMEAGQHNSFLTFRSGELPPTAPTPESNIRESPTPMQTPKPRRVPTQKSHKGGGASQHGHAGYFDQHLPLPATESAYGGVETEDRRNTKDLAMDNLLAALDTPSAPEHPRRSGESQKSNNYDDAYDRAESPVDPSGAHVIASPSSPRTSPNLFNNNNARK
ncbi:hypothetical protein FRC01_010974 [Tulasnella sp. 417]|nr:hypothetical protein FRC01_010974 [Tulasnella sp. 417]